jgi:hypothetical protein
VRGFLFLARVFGPRFSAPLFTSAFGLSVLFGPLSRAFSSACIIGHPASFPSSRATRILSRLSVSGDTSRNG